MVFDGVEREVTIPGKYELSATLTVPLGADELFPAVVIVPGTGSADRDGNLKSFEMNLYKHLAEFITSLGFVTIRYDKRGIGKSGGDNLICGMHDLVDDVISNVQFIQQLPNVDAGKIILLGHSEGCILNAIAYHRHPVAGLLLIAGAGSGLKSALIYQNGLVIQEIQHMNGLKGKLLKLLVKEEAVVKKQNKLFESVQSSAEDFIKIQFQKFPAKWLREHLQVSDEHVLNLLKQADCPILVLNGDMDVQADIKHMKNIEALGQENIKCCIIEKMNHMLREHNGELSVLNLRKQYKKQIQSPLHPDLLREIEDWLSALFLRK